MKPSTFLFALFLGHAFLGGSEPAAPTPLEQATAFYTALRQERIEGLPDAPQMKRLRPYLTAEIAALFERARKEQEKFIQAHPDDKAPWIEGDLFSSLFEGPQSWSLDVVRMNEDKAEVTVTLRHEENGSKVVWQDVLVLKPTAEGWKVDDIRMGGEWAFNASGASLKKNLEPEP